ncbi:MAG: hypothetical protein U5K30_14310 [Acidimicrobiales bacterium]|nr:hypothetical protein [Acidimicrobiales bacterium]
MGTTHPHVQRRRSVTTIAAAIIAIVALFVPTSGLAGAQADTGATPPEAAGSWLADQLVDGERFETEFDGTIFFDYGLTADTVVALAAAGVADGFGASATAWLGSSSITSGYGGDGSSSASSGGLAKLAIVAQTRGLDATDWGEDGVDLIQRLLDLEDAGGRFVDIPDFGNDFKTFSHAFAIVALARQDGVGPSAESLDLLLSSQCADGGFSGDLDPAPEDCTSGVDSTATALFALFAADRPADEDEIDDAVTFLLDIQAGDGSFSSSDTGANANSTGLAVYALDLAGEAGAVEDGAQFLRSLQRGCDAESDQGAIALSAGDFAPGTATRATAQAMMGLTGTGYVDASAAGATTDQPRLDCPDPTATTTSTTTTTTAAEPDSSVEPAASPAATPTRRAPTFTG